MSSNNATPPKGNDWGERTIQSCRNYRAPGYWKSDAYEMGQRYSITDVDVEAFTAINENAIVYPDLIIHERDPTITTTEKGSNAIIRGKKKGCGKSTLLKHLSRQMMSHNGERIIWRGSASRSEWLPFRKWTTVYLPKHATVETFWMHESEEDPAEAVGDQEVLEEIDDLEGVVRDVVIYEDLFDLLTQIGEGPKGTFNVVYPDPSFSGCEDVFAQTERFHGEVPYVPTWEATEEQPATPLIHWWYAFIIARVDHGPFQPWCLAFDEAGDITPSRSEISQDEHRTFDKVTTTRSAMADSRRAFLSWLFVCHYEEQLFDEIRREADWRIHMPDGSPNPKKKLRSSHPLGFDKVPMYADLMDRRGVGTALCYDEDRFTLFSWQDIPNEEGDESRWLKVRVDEPEVKPRTDAARAELEFDDRVFYEWQNQAKHRLYVNEPGGGYLSIKTAEIVEDLDSPIEGLAFVEELRTREGRREILMTDGEKDLVVARIPTPESRQLSDSGGVEVGA